MTGFSLGELVPTWTVATQILKGDFPGHPFRGNQYEAGVISGRAADLKERSRNLRMSPNKARSMREDHEAVARMHREAADAINAAVEKPFATVSQEVGRKAVQDHKDAAKAHDRAAAAWHEAEQSPKVLGQDAKQERTAAARASESAAQATERAIQSPIAQAA